MGGVKKPMKKVILILVAFLVIIAVMAIGVVIGKNLSNNKDENNTVSVNEIINSSENNIIANNATNPNTVNNNITENNTIVSNTVSETTNSTNNNSEKINVVGKWAVATKDDLGGNLAWALWLKDDGTFDKGACGDLDDEKVPVNGTPKQIFDFGIGDNCWDGKYSVSGKNVTLIYNDINGNAVGEKFTFVYDSNKDTLTLTSKSDSQANSSYERVK